MQDLAKDIVRQSLAPVLWVISDDSSNDKTWSIIEYLEEKFSWIRGVRLEPHQDGEYAHGRYAEVVNQGFKNATEFCKKHDFRYDFLAVVDADVRLENRYFEKLIKAFQTDPRLGIASGLVYEKEMPVSEVQRSNAEPRGCALVFRRECLEMIGGFQGHTNSLVKARNRNWTVEVVPSAKVFHQRRSWLRKNYFLTAGMYAYLSDYHPLNAFLTGAFYVVRLSPRMGLYYLQGYITSFVTRKEKTEDEEIKEYYRSSFNRLLERISEKLRQIEL